MKDTGHIAFSDGTFEHFGCIGFGVSCVDDQWKSGLPSGVDMRFEATALGITIGLIVVKIETAFADCNHALVASGFDKHFSTKVGD